MARRRKNLSEKRNEEEKQDTINRLLKKQAPKRRGKISAAEIAAGAETPDVPMNGYEEEEKPDPIFIRWVNNAEGSRLGVPIEWKDKAIAKPFGNTGWRLIEEVEG
jgi:Ino eighty subunit 2